MASLCKKGSKEATSIEDFSIVMGVAHTVVLEQDDGKSIYQAESPDEAALVEAAEGLGFRFAGRRGRTLFLEVSDPANPEMKKMREYDVLAINEFNSTRKRMSVLVKSQGKYILLAKGADNVMEERASKA